MEYVRPAAGRNGLRFEYELLFDGDVETSAPQMIGLIDVTTISTSQGSDPDLASRLQAARTHLVPALQGNESDEKACVAAASGVVDADDRQDARLRKLSPKSRSRSAIAAAPSSESSLLAADSGG